MEAHELLDTLIARWPLPTNISAEQLKNFRGRDAVQLEAQCRGVLARLQRALAPANEPYSIDEHREFIKRLHRGAATVEEYQATFERFRRQQDDLRHWADRRPLSELRRRSPWLSARSKAELINQQLQQMARE